MATLEQHVARRLVDPDFRAAYEAWCEACPFTLDLSRRIAASGTPIEELAAQIGLDPEKIAALVDADCCDYAVLERLCRHFGIAPPKACPRGPA
jgi:hypothetical protein